MLLLSTKLLMYDDYFIINMLQLKLIKIQLKLFKHEIFYFIIKQFNDNILLLVILIILILTLLDLHTKSI